MVMEFNWNNPELAECQRLFMELPADERIYMSHYELTDRTGYGTAQLWKEFLMDKRVSDWLQSETQLLKETQMRKLIKNVNDNERSVGAAQMLNALSKVTAPEDKKEGELIVYSYVPLNAREEKAPNVIINTQDLFI